MSLRMPRSCESLATHGDYSVEKALSELCPKLNAGISLNTRRYLTLLNSNKSTKDDTPAENEKSFKSRGSLKRDSFKSNVSLNNSSTNDSANINLFGESGYISLNFTDKGQDQLINPLTIQYVEINGNEKDAAGQKPLGAPSKGASATLHVGTEYVSDKIELFVKDITVAHKLAEEIENLKYYIRACPYNSRLAMFLDYLFNLHSPSNIPIHEKTVSKEILKDIVKSSTGHLSKKDIYSYISPGSTGLRFDEFYMVYRYILNMARKSKKHKDQIEAVFVTYLIKGDRKLGHMGVKSFYNFLKSCQHDLNTDKENDEQENIDEEIANLYEKMAKYTSRPQRPQNNRSSVRWSAVPSMTMQDFLDYLYSTENDILDPKCHEVTDDMTRPLAHYFINSSHNTYLTGAQLNSESSEHCYGKLLRKGVRCLELDCWDGDYGVDEDEPKITHGNTKCTNISLRSVVQNIAKNAFVGENKWPVILSLEDHCSLEQQEKMANIFKEEFGDMLLTEPVSTGDPDVDEEFEKKNDLPSPNQLKGKIILKHKKLNVTTCEYKPSEEVLHRNASFKELRSHKISNTLLTKSASSASLQNSIKRTGGLYSGMNGSKENEPQNPSGKQGSIFISQESKYLERDCSKDADYYSLRSVSYLLPEGHVDWIQGIATIVNNELVFTWNRSRRSSRSNSIIKHHVRKSRRLSTSASDGRHSKKGMQRSYSEELPEHRSKHSSTFAMEKKNKYSTSSNDSSIIYRSDSSDIDEINSHQGSRYGSIMTCGSIDEESSDENGYDTCEIDKRISTGTLTRSSSMDGECLFEMEGNKLGKEHKQENWGNSINRSFIATKAHGTKVESKEELVPVHVMEISNKEVEQFLSKYKDEQGCIKLKSGSDQHEDGMFVVWRDSSASNNKNRLNLSLLKMTKVYHLPITTDSNGYGFDYINFPRYPRLCDLVIAYKKSFSIPDSTNAKGYSFLPGLAKQVPVIHLHKAQNWYFPRLNEETVERMLSYRIEENGIFLVWENDQCINHSGPRDILSFTYNWNVYHVRLEIKLVPNEYEQSPCKNNLHCLEIGGTEIILSSISDAISHFMKNPLYKDLMLMAPFGFVKETSYDNRKNIDDRSKDEKKHSIEGQGRYLIGKELNLEDVQVLDHPSVIEDGDNITYKSLSDLTIKPKGGSTRSIRVPIKKNVFQLVNSSKIRPDVESDNPEMSTLRIYSCDSDSTNNFNFNLCSSYYFSFENKNNSLFDKLSPYLDYCGSSCSISTSEKNVLNHSNGDRSLNGDENTQNNAFRTRGRLSSKAEKLMQQYEEDQKEFDKKVAKNETRKIAPELSDLIIYFISVPFKQQTLEDVKSLSKVAGGRCETMSSLNESTANLRMVRHRKAFQVYHQKQISRVYPKGLRYDSSNYNPVQFWLSGVQLAAINFQTPEKELQINQGWFLKNGGCGYVLKPNCMTKENACFDKPLPSSESFLLQVSVISGRHLSMHRLSDGSVRKSPTNTFVKIEIIGHDVDRAVGWTKICQKNSLNPSWDERFDFRLICAPSLAVIRFSVYHRSFSLGTKKKPDELLCQATLPLSCIRTGFRSISMLNNFAEAESGLPVLLVHVQKSMPEMFRNMTGKTDIQDMMRNLQIRMTETAKAKKKGGLTCDENLKITHEEEQNNTLLEDLAEMIKKQTEETKENKDEKEEQQETNVTKITSTPFNFQDDIFPNL